MSLEAWIAVFGVACTFTLAEMFVTRRALLALAGELDDEIESASTAEQSGVRARGELVPERKAS